MARKQDFFRTCDPNLTPLAATRSAEFTPRRAVDASGRVGFLYDASCDKVLHKSNINFNTQSVNSRGLPKCYVESYNIDKPSQLLEFISTHHGLQLSIALEMIPAKGVGALINYSHPVDRYTRFINYIYYSRTEYLSDHEFHRSELKEIDTRATHVVALVNWGIELTAVVQLPADDKQAKAIDDIIKKLCNCLDKDQARLDLSPNDISLLQTIVPTEVFANIPDLSKINSIVDLYHNISRIKNDTTLHEPYNYNLCRIEYFYVITSTKHGTFNELELDPTHEIKHYLFQLSRNFKRLTKRMRQDYPYLRQHLQQQLDDTRTKWSNLEQMYASEIQRLQNIVIRIRRGEIGQNTLYQAFHSDTNKQLTQSVDDFDYDLNIIQEKEQLIRGLIEKRFHYLNAADRGIENGDKQQKLEGKLCIEDNLTCIICFNGTLYKQNKSEWDKLHTQLLRERGANPLLRFAYADFSYCSYTLNHFLILPSSETNNVSDALRAAITLLSERVKSDQSTENNNNKDVRQSTTTTTSSQRSKSYDAINILLLGESGVGKSTFINAFVNYLKFDTLEQAQDNAVVLIPVSFIMTSGDDFSERLVIFDEQDDMGNEDHYQFGQSVTQHCKSYVFTLRDGEDSGKKLRIIDTPGIGDVRGITQDDINMQHTLSYINNLTHLNVVCILMKPNNARLNIFFRSCFMQLFDLFGENARDKIIFCFTNARSSFYTPGDTAPLLKELLGSLPIRGIPFTKENTYCFDNNSFRYLVATQNGIPFSDIVKEGHKGSWKRSSAESKRFLKYIRTKMTLSLIPDRWKSTKYAQLRISLMIRPMLEAMRNTFRNMILWKTGSRTVSLELRPKKIASPSAICFECNRESYKVNNFWITADCLHVFQNKCRTCTHNSSEHMQIYYELMCKTSNQSVTQTVEEMKKMLDDLCEKSATFAHFLRGIGDTSQNDPFLLGIKRMIKEEDDICEKKRPCELNSTLVERLKQLKSNFEAMRKKMAAEKVHLQLSDIHNKIEEVNKYPIIQSQMSAIKEWQKLMLKIYEHEVPTS
jgi:hypothetical protein